MPSCAPILPRASPPCSAITDAWRARPPLPRPPPPRLRAAFAGQLPCVRALLSAGARPSAADASFLDMRTPLHKAAGQGHREVCVALLEAGADPNSRDAAGKSALDVLDDAAPASSTTESESGGGGGGGAEACSIVVLSSGAERDWEGTREALERFGGQRKDKEAAAGRGDAGGDRAGCCEDADGGGAGPVVAAPLPSPVVSSPSASKQVLGADAGTRGCEETLAGAGAMRTSSRESGGKSRAVIAVAAPAPGALKGQPKDGTSASAVGIPCGECNLPKVVMVRASCCGGLLCKTCSWEICARRDDCRRCRDASGS